MSDGTDSNFDVRFDPAFQRGFDPAIPIEEYVPDSLPPRAPVPPANPAVATVTAAQFAATPDAPLAQEPADPTSSGEHESVQLLSTEASVTRTGRNPFLLILVIVSIVLISGGVWLFERTGDAFNSTEVRSQGDYVELGALNQAAPFVVMLGILTAVGVLFVFAASGRSRR